MTSAPVKKIPIVPRTSVSGAMGAASGAARRVLKRQGKKR
jgi:hypothetical protein